MEPDEIKATIERLITKTASLEDRLFMQRALLEGKVVFETGGRDVAVEGDIQKSVVITGDHNQVKIELGESAYGMVRERIFPTLPGIAPPFPALVFVGREDDLLEIKRRVGLSGEKSGNGITVVRGWPGVGKTTLVGVIGRDPDVMKIFPDGVLWTSLNQQPNLLSVIAAWGRALGTDDLLRVPTLGEATQRLAALLQSKRMLLIVDDVWNEGDAAPFMQARSGGCVLLITTRLNSVADAIAPTPEAIYNLPVLTEENALKLIGILVPSIVKQHQDECRELVEALECLPLALHVAGRLLKSEERLGWGVADLLRDIREGARKITDEQAPINRAEGGAIPTVSALLQKSTDMLDEQTRDYFAFLGPIAPKPATFDESAMKAMWQMNDPKPVIRKLVKYGLLEPVGSGRFQMHALLVQHALSLLED
jgi:NB-ARC domain